MPLRMLCQVVYGGLGSFQSGLFGLFIGFFNKQIGELKGEVTKKRIDRL